jgi:hypothetical protein
MYRVVIFHNNDVVLIPGLSGKKAMDHIYKFTEKIHKKKTERILSIDTNDYRAEFLQPLS